jgi:glyoxylase-like metal-dependent hydrolase (beta-lactamase superfamily II)
MKIHHLKCGCMCPMATFLGPSFLPKEIICHCLLIETPQKLILVDTGIGTEDTKDPSRLGLLNHILGVQKNLEFTAVEQIKKMGYSPQDVTDIIPTHLDIDHASGIADFKWAKIHVQSKELKAAQLRTKFIDKQRYSPHLLDLKLNWLEYNPYEGENWMGFEAVKEINGIPPEILFVNLPGHTPGHSGVAIRLNNSWLLHAGDAYFNHNEFGGNNLSPLGLRWYQKFANESDSQAKETQKKLSKIKDEVKIICSHDLDEYIAITAT